MNGQTILLVAATIIIAVVLDLGILRWLRRRSGNPSTPGAMLLGSYSPLLAWIKGLKPIDLSGRVGRFAGAAQRRFARLASAVRDGFGWLADRLKRLAASLAAPLPPKTLRERFDLLFVPPVAARRAETTLAVTRYTWLEWAALLVLVAAFCAGFLRFQFNQVLPGNESEVFQMLDKIFYDSLVKYGQFPEWNPYIYTGLPMVGDPMFHSFNPVVTLPVLLFGAESGFKLAVFFSYLLGAFGMWRLCATLGLGAVPRLWIALLFTFAGQPLARFFQGQYLFIFAWAWIPWMFVALTHLYRHRRRTDLVAGAFCLAIMFLSGNAYYVFYTAIFTVLYVVLAAFSIGPEKPRLRIDLRWLVAAGLMVLLSLGLCAVQLLPTLEFWPLVSKDGGILGSQNLASILTDFLSKDTARPDIFAIYPAREEFYAYIGIWPFLPLVFLPLVFFKRPVKRLVGFLGVMLLFSVLWIGMQYMPWADLYQRIDFLYRFRHQGRMILFVQLAVLLAAGLSIDYVWGRLTEGYPRPRWKMPVREWLRSLTKILVAGLLLAFFALSVRDVFMTNRPIAQTVERDINAFAAMTWLRQTDPTVFYTRHNPDNAAYAAANANELRLIQIWYHYRDIRNPDSHSPFRPVTGNPKYQVQSMLHDTLPEQSDLIYEKDGYGVYQSRTSLPFAFLIDKATLAGGAAAGEVTRQEVAEQTAYMPGPNQVEIVASSRGGETLIALVTDYPGWQLWVDGRRADKYEVSGYLAADTLPGTHEYVFKFISLPFRVGLLISLVCLGVAGAWVWQENHARWRAWLVTVKTALARQAEARQEAELARAQSPTHFEFDLLGLHIVVTRAQSEAAVRAGGMAAVLFVLSLGVYAFIHFFALDRYPIYFFCDEATNSLLAADLIKNGFKDSAGNLFPVVFDVGVIGWRPLFSAYPHALTVALFGKSIVANRATTGVIALLAAVAVSLTLKQAFRARYWWAAGLVLGLIPAWFLHSRTGFETAMATAFYAGFLWLYILYRTRSPRALIPAVFLGAAAFYTYSNFQVILGLTALLFILVDFRYHLQNRRVALPALGLGLLMLWPFVNFQLQHTAGYQQSLWRMNSFLFQDIPAGEKVLKYFSNYLYGLSPAYWFWPNEQDLPRHQMNGYGMIWPAMLPFFLLGVYTCIRNFRQAPHRLLLLALLTIPAGASLVDIAITRVLSFVIPATLLVALGLEMALGWVERRLPHKLTAWATFAGLAAASLLLLNSALTSGPFWSHDYGLYGMQYGAKQLFEGVVPRYLAEDPENRIVVEPSWANSSDLFEYFFLNQAQQERVTFDSLEGYLQRPGELSPSTYFITIPDVLANVRKSGLFKTIDVVETIPYPDGAPGFHVVRLEYVDNVDEMFAEMKAARQALETTALALDGRNVTVRYSRLDMGDIDKIFDGDPNSLMRGLEANPFKLELTFEGEIEVSGLVFNAGTMNSLVKVSLYAPGETEPRVFTQTFRDLREGNTRIDFRLSDAPLKAHQIVFEIQDVDIPTGEPANVHLWEFDWY